MNEFSTKLEHFLFVREKVLSRKYDSVCLTNGNTLGPRMQASYTQCRKSNELLLDIVDYNGYIDRLKTQWGQSAFPYQRDVVIAYHPTLHLVKYFSSPPIERPNHVKFSLIREERLF